MELLGWICVRGGSKYLPAPCMFYLLVVFQILKSTKHVKCHPVDHLDVGRGNSSPADAECRMEGEEDDDRPHPQAVALSQTCWEYKTLVQSQNKQSKQQREQQQNYNDVVSADVVDSSASRTAPQPPDDPGEGIGNTNDHKLNVRGGQSKRLKTTAAIAPSTIDGGSNNVNVEEERRQGNEVGGSSTSTARCPSAITLQALRLAGTAQWKDDKHATWDVFVLVLQASGLQNITSKAGFDVGLCTLLVADPTLSFFRVTLWRRAARRGAQLMRAGDLARLNGLKVSSFQGTVQANSTDGTCFRIVWRDDTFTTPQDSRNNTMLCQTSHNHGRHHFPPGPLLSQEDVLAVSRDDACDLAAWAKKNYPSVTRLNEYSCGEAAGHGDGAVPRDGSLGAVRKGIETTVRGCVLKVTDVERMWTWETVGGKRRKDLIARATALLTDGLDSEMTLQLWGDLASQETVTMLTEGAIIAANANKGERKAGAGLIRKPTVFEFTKLQPEFSFACEALVLNTTKRGAIRKLARDSREASSVIDALVSAAAVSSPAAPGDSHQKSRNQFVDTGETLHQETSVLPEAGALASPRRFASVAELINAKGFAGACCLDGVVVRKVEAHQLRLPAVALSPFDDVSHSVSAPRRPLSVSIFIGDPDDVAQDGRRSAGEAVARVAVDGGALQDLLGGIPKDLLALGMDGQPGSGGVSDVGVAAVVATVTSLLDGLEIGGEQGEGVDVELACLPCLDANGRVVSGGSSYRLVHLQPSGVAAGFNVNT